MNSYHETEIVCYCYYYWAVAKSKMVNSLKDKKVLITGATDGLGKLIAKHLTMTDAVVILHGRNEEKGSLLVDELYKQTQNGKLSYYNGDFASL